MDKQALIDKAVELWQGKFKASYYYVTHLYDGGDCNSSTSRHSDWIFNMHEFTQRAKELGWVSGYLWGKEYPTNGKKPDLDDDVLIEWSNACGDDATCKIGNLHWFFGSEREVVKFTIIDQRFEPKQPESHSKPVKDLSDVIFAVSDAIHVAIDAGAMPAARELQKINRDLLAKDSVIGIGKPSVDNSWHEKGEFPPAGTECEVMFNGNWFETYIVGMNGEWCVYVSKGFEPTSYNGDNDPNNFRPIKTEKEIFVQKVINALHYSHATTDKERAERLYELGARLVSQESSS